MIPVIMPGNAEGNTTNQVVSHFVAPTPKEASLQDFGTPFSASSVAVTMNGRDRQVIVKAPAKILACPTRVTNKATPNSPKMMDGIPAKLLRAYRIKCVIPFTGAYSDKYIAAPTPNGITNNKVMKIKYTVPTMGANNPPFVVGPKIKDRLNEFQPCMMTYIIKKKRAAKTTKVMKDKTTHAMDWDVFGFIMNGPLFYPM
jgi:hypothetical protein